MGRAQAMNLAVYVIATLIPVCGNSRRDSGASERDNGFDV